MLKVVKIKNHISEVITDYTLEVPKPSHIYKNAFDEAYILMPRFYPTNINKIYENDVIYLSDLAKPDPAIKIDDEFVDYILIHNDWIKMRTYYVINDDKNDCVKLYEIKD